MAIVAFWLALIFFVGCLAMVWWLLLVDHDLKEEPYEQEVEDNPLAGADGVRVQQQASTRRSVDHTYRSTAVVYGWHLSVCMQSRAVRSCARVCMCAPVKEKTCATISNFKSCTIFCSCCVRRNPLPKLHRSHAEQYSIHTYL